VTEIRVRLATPDDRGFVLGLVPELAAFGPPPWRTAPRMIETDTLVLAAALDDSTAGEAMLVAEDAAAIRLGFIHLISEADYYTRRQCGHIADLIVAPEARGRGVGEMLLSAAEEWAAARGYSLLTLNVFVGNTRARALYERSGFGAETVRYVKDLGKKVSDRT
jgi:ribosomal protein S18 acetylase RimI-like enzyme